jgi:two-component system, NtrC family, C4-dicarboxylate transport response regulator DctD
MPPAMQVKLLRVLQERKIERLGSNDPVTVDFRVIAASKPNLIELVEMGQFRHDLFYRLNLAVIDLPPLRERKEDIPLLFEHFVLDAARRHQRPAPVVTERQLSEFLAMTGRAMGGSSAMLPIDSCWDYSMIPSAFGRPAVNKVSLSEQIDRFEQVLIEDALAEHRGNAELASRCLGNSEMNALRQDSKVRAVN